MQAQCTPAATSFFPVSLHPLLPPPPPLPRTSRKALTAVGRQIAYLLDRYGTPRFMEWWERVGLILGGVMGHYLPSLVVPPILPAAPGDRIVRPARRGRGTRALPGGAPRGRHPAQPEPAGRGDPGRGGGGAAPRRLSGAARARGRRVHLGEGVVRLQPDQPGRVRADRRARSRSGCARSTGRRWRHLHATRRPRHAEVREPRHGGVPRPRPHRRRRSAGARRGGVPAALAPASCCRPTCPTRIACSAS